MAAIVPAWTGEGRSNLRSIHELGAPDSRHPPSWGVASRRKARCQQRVQTQRVQTYGRACRRCIVHAAGAACSCAGEEVTRAAGALQRTMLAATRHFSPANPTTSLLSAAAPRASNPRATRRRCHRAPALQGTSAGPAVRTLVRVRHDMVTVSCRQSDSQPVPRCLDGQDAGTHLRTRARARALGRIDPHGRSIGAPRVPAPRRQPRAPRSTRAPHSSTPARPQRQAPRVRRAVACSDSLLGLSQSSSVRRRAEPVCGPAVSEVQLN